MAVYDDGRLSSALHFSRLRFQVKRDRYQLNWKEVKPKSCIPAISPCSGVIILFAVCIFRFFYTLLPRCDTADRTAIFRQNFPCLFCLFLLQTFKQLASHWDGNQATEFNGRQRVLLHCSRRFYSSCFFFLPHLSNLPFSPHVAWLPSYLPLLATLFLKSCILLYNLWGNCKQTGLQLKLIWKLKLDIVPDVFRAFH